jgi:hypothetical protein
MGRTHQRADAEERREPTRREPEEQVREHHREAEQEAHVGIEGPPREAHQAKREGGAIQPVPLAQRDAERWLSRSGVGHVRARDFRSPVHFEVEQRRGLRRRQGKTPAAREHGGLARLVFHERSDR